MKEKDPYLSELDALKDLQPEEPTDSHIESPPLPEERLPEEGQRVSEEAFTLAGDVPVSIVVILGRKTVTVKDLMDLRTGQVVELDRVPNEAVDVMAGGKVIAKGELVEIDGKLGVRVLKLLK